MDAASFERVYDSFQKFHVFFASSFGRKQWREHSRNYLRALLVQAGERRNAENLSESVGTSARAMQRFLTEARWSDDSVIGQDDCKVYYKPFAVGLLNHRQLEQASFDKPRMSRHQ